MSTLKDLIASDIDDVFMNTDEFADSISFRSGNGLPISTTGIVNELEFDVWDDQGFPQKITRYRWLVPVADLPGIEPRSGDGITHNADYYEVAPVDKRQPAAKDVTGNLWAIDCKRITSG